MPSKNSPLAEWNNDLDGDQADELTRKLDWLRVHDSAAYQQIAFQTTLPDSMLLETIKDYEAEHGPCEDAPKPKPTAKYPGTLCAHGCGFLVVHESQLTEGGCLKNDGQNHAVNIMELRKIEPAATPKARKLVRR